MYGIVVYSTVLVPVKETSRISNPGISGGTSSCTPKWRSEMECQEKGER